MSTTIRLIDDRATSRITIRKSRNQYQGRPIDWLFYYRIANKSGDPRRFIHPDNDRSRDNVICYDSCQSERRHDELKTGYGNHGRLQHRGRIQSIDPFPREKKVVERWSRQTERGATRKVGTKKEGADANNSNDSTNKWTQPNSRSRSRPQQRLQSSRRRTRGTTVLYLPERIPNRQYEPTGGRETIKSRSKRVWRTKPQITR